MLRVPIAVANLLQRSFRNRCQTRADFAVAAQNVLCKNTDPKSFAFLLLLLV